MDILLFLFFFSGSLCHVGWATFDTEYVNVLLVYKYHLFLKEDIVPISTQNKDDETQRILLKLFFKFNHSLMYKNNFMFSEK